jgi:hypothetical protein
MAAPVDVSHWSSDVLVAWIYLQLQTNPGSKVTFTLTNGALWATVG